MIKLVIFFYISHSISVFLLIFLFSIYFHLYVPNSLSGALNPNYANSNMSHIQDNFIYFSFKPMQSFLLGCILSHIQDNFIYFSFKPMQAKCKYFLLGCIFVSKLTQYKTFIEEGSWALVYNRYLAPPPSPLKTGILARN